jgi:hypothetical protein
VKRFPTVLIGAFACVFAAAPLGHIESAAVAPVAAEAAANLESPHEGGLTPSTAREGGLTRVRPLDLALKAVGCAVAAGEIEAPPTLTLIDYSRPSTEPRLRVYDMATGAVLFEELVAHGRNSGDNLATSFSDAMNSHQSSIGLFVARDTYVGSNGYSLRMDGLEPGFNGRARDRAIVMHGAWYVDPALAQTQGRIGRSWGCPALREAVARDVIDTVAGGGVIFSYYPDAEWLEASRFLNCDAAATALVAAD